MRTASSANRMEVAQHLHVGVDQAGFAIGHTVLAAELMYERLGATQVGSGHAGEQVVLDLVVEPSQDEVDQPTAAYVTGGQHLAAQEVAAVLGGEDRHALVVG